MMRYFFLLALFGSISLLEAASVRSDHTEAELVAERTALTPNTTNWIALRLKMDPTWHTYWSNPGEAGMVTRVRWEDLPEGVTIGDFRWPPPKRYIQASLVNYVYEGEVFLLMPLTLDDAYSGDKLDLKASASWLECDDQMCVPGKVELALSLPVEATGAELSAWADDFAQTRADWPQDLSANWAASAVDMGDSYRLTLSPVSGVNPEPGELYAYIDTLDGSLLVQAQLTQDWQPLDGGGYVVDLPKTAYAPASVSTLSGVIQSEDGWLSGGKVKDMALAVTLGDAPSGSDAIVNGEPTPSTTSMGYWQVLLLALGGGLILNLMPCVFPVMGLKILGFVNQAGQERSKIVAHGLVFTLGVMLSFWVLAAVISLLDLRELSFLMKEPIAVYLVVVVLLLLGLNMVGVYEVGQSLVGAGSNLTAKSGYSGTFFSGLLAVVIGTPCAAPLLAGALGATFTQQSVSAFSVFTTLTAMGIGLSLPYLLLAAFPSLVSRLPKPGPWMESLKQSMAFIFFGFALYFLWTLAGQIEDEFLLRDLFLGLAVIGFGTWVYGRYAKIQYALPKRMTAIVLAAFLVLAPATFAIRGILVEAEQRSLLARAAMGEEVELDFLVWEEWSPARQAALIEAGRMVYVDFTARWCLTCQVNKTVAFGDDKVIQTVLADNVALLKADWTNEDPIITAELAKYQRAAVPFNVLYAPGLNKPIELPEVLTPGIVLDALAQAEAAADSI
ncbi:MAG: protein-disulfide reductase DsbD domain-containing protein [Verrucomicrobiota bacterium]